MINSGYESESIYTLACFYKPIASEEVQPHLEAVFAELNLTAKNKTESQKSHISYFLNKIVKQEDVRTNLKNTLYFYSDFAVDKIIVDLFVLEYAWDNLAAGGVNGYYSDINLDNIEQKFVEKAKKWMCEN